MAARYRRILPLLAEDNAFFWHSGRDGRLRILRCGDCGFWIHPVKPLCPRCFGRDVAPDIVSGRATVFSVTVNHKAWGAGLAVPYAVGIVELAEQPGLRMTCGFLGIAPDDVRIDMAVEADFERDEDVWLPMFRPARAGDPAEIDKAPRRES